MPAQALLRLLTAAAAAFCLAALSLVAFKTFALGGRAYLSEPHGSGRKGVLYAFGRGMLEKESVSLHLPTFAGGLFFHAAVFAALLYLALVILAPSLALPRQAFRAVFAAGAAVGAALFVKRAARPKLRRLSCPDDFAANLLVDAFLAAAFLHTLDAATEPILLGTALALFVYVPFGKIRHCFFFFVTRLAFGIHFGRRGTLPGSAGRP